MKRYIAYFDYLGYRSLIENNDLEEQQFAIKCNLTTIETALSKGERTHLKNEWDPDFSNSKLNCINYSDTIIFFSKDDTIESLIEILTVSQDFNWSSIFDRFPLRGALVYEELGYYNFSLETSKDFIYCGNPIYGKGLIVAHEKAESQNWAGSIIDESLITQIVNLGIDADEFLKPFAKKYKIPYKNKKEEEGYVLNIPNQNIEKSCFEDIKNCITATFSNFNKPIDDKPIKDKIENTLSFLESCIE